MNILVAVDLSPATDAVVEAARGVAELTGVSVYILHAVETEADFVCPEGDPETRRIRVAKEFPMEHGRVQALATKLLDDGLDASALLVCGPGVETTLKEAEILEAGLIIIGTHGHGAVYDVLIGSYSAGIIRKSKLPVLVVPVRDI
ncbi:MAG: universal stress protein [Xanthomonadales bacterium]|nr:universal stress protein [Xanthomonadales bacterium]